MSIFGILGSIVLRLPKFIKDQLEKAVFLQPQENLPERRTGTNVGIVIGGADGRVEKAIELYKRGLIDYFLVSGGIGADSIDKDLTEAENYANTLIAAGIADNHIWIENRSTNTLENVEYSTEILARQAEQPSHGFIYPIIITSGFHLKRTHALFEKSVSRIRRTSAFGISIAHSGWSAAPFASCELNTWRNTKKGCTKVAKEAVCLFIYRLIGKI